MIIRRLNFEDGDEVDIGPAIAELNSVFHAASMAHVQPFTFAVQAGRLSEERSLEILADAYAEGVMMGSPTPELTGFSTKQWRKWLLNNPEKFANIRSIAEVKRNFDPDAEVSNAVDSIGASAEPSVEAPKESN